jgi:hypothetical protein
MYDMKVELMPECRFPSYFGKKDRAWQVVMIERDQMGSPMRDVQVQRANLTYDEATSVCNQLVQELRKAERESNKDSRQSSES